MFHMSHDSNAIVPGGHKKPVFPYPNLVRGVRGGGGGGTMAAPVSRSAAFAAAEAVAEVEASTLAATAATKALATVSVTVLVSVSVAMAAVSAAVAMWNGKPPRRDAPSLAKREDRSTTVVQQFQRQESRAAVAAALEG